MSDLWDEEYREYVRSALPTLRRLAYLLCQDAHRSDDLVQNTLVKLYVRWERARTATSLAAYARTVLMRTFLSERRTSWARRVVLVDAVPESSIPTGLDAASTLALRAALATLPLKQRAVLALRFFEDLTVEETAEALGFPTGTVKSHTSRGLAAMRRALPGEHSTRLRS